jgi:TolA-binding protein
MKSEHDAPFDLLALARRGELSVADQRRLRDLLASSPEARLLYEAGCAFDREAPVQPGDDALVDRIERRVQARLKPSTTGARRRWIAGACIVAAVVATSAVAASVVRRSHQAPVLPSAPPTAPPAPVLGTPEMPVTSTVTPTDSAAASAAVSAPASVPTSVPVSATASPPPPVPTRPAPASVEPTPAPGPAQPDIPSPHALFAAANQARVSGDRAEAIRLSRQLVSLYPSSSEALTAHLSLGMMYLQGGNARLALDEFRAYRKLSPRGAGAEPLWGESQALHQLGRTAEERATLTELLASYPQSAYSDAARKRLALLPSE